MLAPITRRAVSQEAAIILSDMRDELARSISEEDGETLAEATIEVEKSADVLDFYGATARLPSRAMLSSCECCTASRSVVGRRRKDGGTPRLLLRLREDQIYRRQ